MDFKIALFALSLATVCLAGNQAGGNAIEDKLIRMLGDLLTEEKRAGDAAAVRQASVDGLVAEALVELNKWSVVEANEKSTLEGAAEASDLLKKFVDDKEAGNNIVAEGFEALKMVFTSVEQQILTAKVRQEFFKEMSDMSKHWAIPFLEKDFQIEQCIPASQGALMAMYGVRLGLFSWSLQAEGVELHMHMAMSGALKQWEQCLEAEFKSMNADASSNGLPCEQSVSNSLLAIDRSLSLCGTLGGKTDEAFIAQAKQWETLMAATKTDACFDSTDLASNIETINALAGERASNQAEAARIVKSFSESLTRWVALTSRK